MKKLKLLLLLFTLIKLDGQENTSSLASINGSSLFAVKKFFIKEEFKNVFWTAHKEPIGLPILSDTFFNINHLKTPYSVIQSLLTATTNEWINKLCIKNNAGNLSSSEISFRTSESYKNDSVKILSEFNFKNFNSEYSILLVYFPSVNGYEVHPFALNKTNEGWKIYDGYLSELKGLLLLKPAILEKLLLEEPINNKEFQNFKERYFIDGKYNLTFPTSFLGQYILLQNKIYPSLTVEPNKIPSINKSIIMEVKNFGVIKYWSKEFGSFFIYPDQTELKNHFWAHKTRAIFNSSPEEAFASWNFDKSLVKRKKYLVEQNRNDIKLKQSVEKASLIDSSKWHISFDYKVMFYDETSLYVLLFYKEWINNNFEGIKSQLLKNVNGKWYIDNSRFTESEPVKLATMFDGINYDVLKALLSKDLSNNTIIDSFVKNVKDKDGRIFIDDIVEKFNKFCKSELRREKPNYAP